MKDLHSILKAVSRGKMDIPKAETLIQELFEAALNPQDDSNPTKSNPRRRERNPREGAAQSGDRAKGMIDSALASLGEKIGFEAFIRKSRELGRKVEFKSGHDGFESKLSIFSAVEVSDDSLVERNMISGSQWKEAVFCETAEVRKNHFTLSQVNNLKCERSNFSANEFGLTQFSDVTVQESRFENNRLSRSQLSDFAMTESDFTHNRLLRTELTGVVFNASRMSNCVSTSSHWLECEFDQSDLQGLRFDDCSFSECRFSNCEIVSSETKILSGLRAKGVNFEGLRSVEDLLKVLEPKPNKEHNPTREDREQNVSRSPERKSRSRRH